MQTLPIQTGAAKEGSEQGRRLLGVISCSCNRRGQLRKTQSPDLTFYSTTHLDYSPRPLAGYCSPVWLIAHLYALIMKSTAADQAGGKEFWDLWLLHLAYIYISGIRAKYIQITLSSLQTGTTGIAYILWIMSSTSTKDEDPLRHSNRGKCYLL